MKPSFVYENESAREISFPLGGIGSGCIGLAGNGQLIDYEIFNRPNKGTHAAFSHFAIKAENASGAVVDQRVLQGDYLGSYMGNLNRPNFGCYGFGPDRASMAAMPHFEKCQFVGEFPLATLNFADKHFPADVAMTAFNPFIPTNEDDSSIPAAYFSFEIHNTSDEDLDYSVAFSQANLYCLTEGMHTYHDENGVKSIHLANRQHAKTDVKYGDMTISTDADDVSHQLYWFRGKWFDNLTTFWQDFANSHKIKNRVYEQEEAVGQIEFSQNDVATLVAHVHVKAGQRQSVRFVLSWNTPNNYNYWTEAEATKVPLNTWKNYYAVLFENSLVSGQYSVKNFDTFYAQTKRFKDALFSCSIPAEAIESISANLSTIKSPTCLRLENGELYGWEGCHATAGSCEGTCAHVWSYTYSIAFLFPRLERSMRTLEYTYSLNDDGGLNFRIMLPLGSPKWGFRPCVDGQYGSVMRAYREYKVSGDKKWLSAIWPQIKASIDFAWSPDNMDQWDLDKDGLMEGRQHHTLDMELFGHNAWLSGMYLGGLKAGALMAEEMGEPEKAQEYLEVFEKGRKALNETLFNGEYFSQNIDIKDRSQLDRYMELEKHGSIKSMQHQDVYKAYWNDEQEEMMYQIGDGCELDQTLAQYHANLMDLGDIFDKDKTLSAVQSIYKYNYAPCMRDVANPCRLYCLNDEGGLLICQWPEGKQKGFIPLPYSEETQNGYEYAAAIQMLQNGLVEEGMTCIKAIRDRYNGVKRNPWNEFECGNNYARSMASYAILLSLHGFQYDMSRGMIGFAPVQNETEYTSFWSLDSGWGDVTVTANQAALSVLYGSLPVQTLKIATNFAVTSVEVDGKSVDFTAQDGVVTLTTCHTVANQIIIK